MFGVDCPDHRGPGIGAKVLLDLSAIETVTNSTHGIHVSYRCTCGNRGTWRTGRHSTLPSPEL